MLFFLLARTHAMPHSSSVVGHYGGAYLGQYGPNVEKVRQVTSQGRMNPPSHIAHVTVVGQLVSDVENRLDESADPDGTLTHAPLLSRDPNTFTMRKGDVALYRDDNYDSFSSDPYDNGEQYFGAVNGIRRDDKVYPAGIVLNESAHKGKSNSSGGDEAGVVIRAGLAGTRNTGPNPIPAFSTVLAVLDPYMIESGNGQKVNGIKYVGESAHKLRPSTIALRSTDVYATMRAIELLVDSEISRHNVSTVTSDMLHSIRRDARDSMQLHRSMPLYRYLGVYIAHAWCNVALLYSVDATAVTHASMQFVLQTLHVFHQNQRKTVNQYAYAVKQSGELAGMSSMPISSVPTYAPTLDTAAASASASTTLLYTPTIVFDNRVLLTLQRELFAARSILCSEQYNYIRKFAIGTNTLAAEVGQEMNMVLGYFHS